MARRFGILRCFRVAVTVFPFTYIVTPFTSLLPTPLTQQIGIFLIMITRGCALIFALPCSTITLTNSAANLRILGVLNGVATSVSAIGRAIGPAVGGYSFSLGTELGYGILPWWILACLSIIAAIPVWCLLETDSLTKEDRLDSRADDSSATNTEPSQQPDPQNRFQT